MEQAIALQVNDLDNVATIFAEGVKDGSTSGPMARPAAATMWR